MPSSRRQFVRAMAASGLLSLGGCLTGAPVTESRATTTEAESTTDDAAAVTDAHEPTRGQAEPVSASRTYTEEDGYEYLPETDDIRYVSAHHASEDNETQDPVYDTVSFDRWASTKCANVASRATKDALVERLGADELESISFGVSSQYTDEMSVGVVYSTHLSRSGSIVNEPVVAFERLVEATPRSATATVTLDGAPTAERTVEVWVDDWVIQNA
ncbi:hypothetical protein [Haloferax sp. YSMS24]|uniref:hypothetical protein n=1 Tax=Haloferax sp. YSMS24 TaxID=3388425 RepID=UPI00398CC325